ncbi:MAG: AAA family ATPase, partial [Nostoc sp.]|uniref:AAA family ATPase n=1 Tax=Nostoc sp. TaxID=1180 RepID=UPI002FFBF0BA
MQVEITIKNYRCFQDSNPARITLSKGFVAFLGTNNSGKSSLLKFFYEFRNLFLTLSDISAWSNIISNQQLSFSFPREVLDSQEVFCNTNNRPLEIELRFIESPPTINSLSFLNKIIITILNSTRLSPTPLVFKTVRETFISHGSSMFWC